jgi:two-component system, response regulator YesN
VTANQGVEAKALIEKAALNHDPFDLVITDLIMPKVDGWQLVQWIQRHHPEILTIILTGVGENGLARKSLRPEVDLYLEKAITPKALRDTISQLDKVKQKKTERNPA